MTDMNKRLLIALIKKMNKKLIDDIDIPKEAAVELNDYLKQMVSIIKQDEG